MFTRMRQRQEWIFFRSLLRSDRRLASVWYGLLAIRSALPAAFAVAMGVLVGTVEDGDDLGVPLAVAGVIFVAMQVAPALHLAISANLGDRTAAWLYDELTAVTSGPPGMGHLEDPELAQDLQVARDFDLGMTGPSLSVSMDFIASGLVDMGAGLVSVSLLFGLRWWAPFVLGGAWLSTHWLLRESGVWKDRQTEVVRNAQRQADYSFRMAVDPPAAKELRLFGLADWTLDRFVTSRTILHRLQYEATRLRERSLLAGLAVVGLGNLVVLVVLADDAASGAIGLGATVAFAQAATGGARIAFGGLNWSLDGASAPVAAVSRLREPMARAGHLASGSVPAVGRPAVDIHFDHVTFAYPAGPGTPVLRELDLRVPAGTSLAIVGQNGAGKTTLAKLLCRLYDPDEGAVRIDGVDLRDFDLTGWRSRVAAVFQDYIRFELPLRDNVAPNGSSDETVVEALRLAGGDGLAGLDTVLAKGYPGGIDLSGGQWQRVALARALAAVAGGAGVVILDEPTAQLDVRGEAEIFERILAATRGCTTILVSHRFSTVRHADRIAVVEDGAVVELGSHDELMAAGGRYRRLFDLQAQRFAAGETASEEDEGMVLDAL